MTRKGTTARSHRLRVPFIHRLYLKTLLGRLSSCYYSGGACFSDAFLVHLLSLSLYLFCGLLLSLLRFANTQRALQARKEEGTRSSQFPVLPFDDLNFVYFLDLPLPTFVSPSVPFYYRRLRLQHPPVASSLDGYLAMSTTAESRPESTPSRPSPAPSTAGSTGTSGITVRGGPNGHMSFRRCVVIFPFAVVVG